jgi:hypothetical protein
MDEQTQPALIEIPPDRFFEIEQADPSRNPEFTAARFLQCRPQEYREITMLRAELVPIATLARMYKVSRNTIAAIDEREGRTLRVEHLKQHNARSYNRLATICRERAQELVLSVDVDKLDAGERIALGRVLAIMMGVAEDKAQLLAGQATSRAETSDPRAAAAEFAEALARMGFGVEDAGAKGEPRAIEAEVGPAMAARPAGDREQGAGVDAAAGAVPGAEGKGLSSDMVSEGRDCGSVAAQGVTEEKRP